MGHFVVSIVLILALSFTASSGHVAVNPSEFDSCEPVDAAYEQILDIDSK